MDTMTQWTELAVCADCLMMIQYGDAPITDEGDEDSEFVALYVDGANDFVTIAPGSDHKDCTHGPDEDCPDDEGWFSYSPCDICRRHWGGTRYPAMGCLG